MIAIVSVPPHLADAVGGDLGRGQPDGVPTKETPHRVYFMVPLLDLRGRRHLRRPEIDIQYFMTREEAFAWGDADAKAWRLVQ